MIIIKTCIPILYKKYFMVYSQKQHNNDSENKEIKAFMMKHEAKITELFHQFQNNSKKSNAMVAQKKVEGLKLIAQGFTIFSCSDEQIIKSFSDSTQIKSMDTKLLLGFCIKQQILSKQIFKCISNKLNRYEEHDTTISTINPFQIENDDVKIEIDDSIDTVSMEQNMALQEGEPIEEGDEEDNEFLLPHLDFAEENYNDDFIKDEKQEVKQYLYKLPKSTTELNYLCQRMKWPTPTFMEEKSKISEVLFQCKVSIVVMSKNQQFWTFTAECQGAVSKKEARRVACLLLLRKVYNRLPEVWEKFAILKKLNPQIQQPLTSNNQVIFKKLPLQNEVVNVQKLNIFKEEPKQQIAQQIIKYLDSIKSCKAEMNLLIGKYKKISPPEIHTEKQDEFSLWPVRISLHDDTTFLVAQERDASKKRAEEKCIKQLLFKLFERDHKRWMSFIAYKKSKKLQ